MQDWRPELTLFDSALQNVFRAYVAASAEGMELCHTWDYFGRVPVV